MTSEDENAATELLANLMQEKYLRDIVMRWLFKNTQYESVTEVILEETKKSDVLTQESYSGIGIPDIVIKNSTNHFLIENKIHARTDLQRSQIEKYKTLLQQDDAKRTALFFLIPADYAHEEEIKKLTKNKDGVYSKYWSDLLEHLYAQDVAKSSPIVKGALEYFRTIIDSHVVETILTSYEVAMLYSPKQIRGVYALSEKIIELAKRFVTSKKYQEKRRSKIHTE